MVKFGKAIVKLRIPILILGVLLLIPSVFGMMNTRINYDMLDYLPGDMDTRMKPWRPYRKFVRWPASSALFRVCRRW